ncbi:MAG: mechanosensitive ion channel [Lachnospiraceae bacterium]|nr:mechanosensitive ion channel [Lachnospiraceae bacterium]MBP3595701.1 mechanosensitive ion channel [Lachnospiraceae bacterium]
MEAVLAFITASILPALIKILIAIVIYYVGTKLMKFIMNVTEKAMEKGKVDAGVQSFIKSALRIVLYIVLAFIIISYLGIATTGIAALFASAGVTVGLALQGSLSNLAGGVLILILKPFKIGDYIVACGEEGTVTDIEIFYTKLSTVDNRKIVIPNGALSNSNITNVSHEEFRRVDLVLGVSYESDVKTVKNILADIAAKNEMVLKDRDINIYINEFAASSIDFGFRVWTKAENYWTLKWQLMEDVKAAFDANHIEIPFNQIDVNMKK